MIDFFVDCLFTTGKMMVGVTIIGIVISTIAFISYWVNHLEEDSFNIGKIFTKRW